VLGYSLKSTKEQVAVLTLASIGSKLIGTAIYPIISRLYTPEQFGDYSVFYSWLFILAPLTTLKYPVLIPIVKTKKEALDIVSLSAWISIIFCSLLIILKIATGFNYTFFPFLICSLFGASLYEVFVFWKTRMSNFGSLALLEISRSISGSLAQLLFGKFQVFINGLIAANVIHKAGLIPILFSSSRVSFFFKILSFKNTKNLFQLAKTKIDIPKFMLPSELMLVISNRAPVLIIVSLYDKSVAGHYGMAIMLVALPLRMVGNSINKVFYAKLKHYDSKDFSDLLRLKKFMKKLRFLLFSIGLVVFFIAFFSPVYIESVLGENWLDTGKYLRILSVPFALELSSIPFVGIFNFFNAEKTLFKLNILKLLIIGTAFILGILLSFEILLLLQVMSSFLVVYYMVYHIVLNRLIGVRVD
jgi:O-antigen/teichoic acid export membrane protein